MKNAVLLVDSGSGLRALALADWLDPEREAQALADSHAWIKRLRHISVDGQPLRSRFTLRGDSLWRFAELYLHKQQTVLTLFRTLAALQHLVETERPLEIGIRTGGRSVFALAPQVARARKIRWKGRASGGRDWLRLARLDLRARALMLGASASRLRPRVTAGRTSAAPVAAFVHSAFWKRGAPEGGAESYIGPVLDSLEARLPAGSVRYVGLGPSENFAARRWWRALGGSRPAPAVVPIERYAPWAALHDSRAVWRERHTMRRALWNSTELREHAVIDRCDCWPVVREELAGIALLQWPWSARAMDEAAAALEALRPRVALTYAEAGGWGRALMLECRRRGIASVGLQHGFIYRHWLNYLHEPDEMTPDRNHPEDAGFPRPALTLLFDDYARAHLEQHGRFPPESLAVTGSPRLDALVAAAQSVTAEDIARARQASGAADPAALVVLVAKYKEVRHVLPPLLQAVAAMPGVQLAIKTHPAETPDGYEAAAGGRPSIRVLPASAPLAPLLRASRAVVTMNSTVALDAAVLGIPALVIGLPNNLSPFVEAGIMAGAAAPGEIGPALNRILYDEGFRAQLERERSAYLARFGMRSDGRAAARAADAVLGCQTPAGTDM
jgi:hypothetical protein